MNELLDILIEACPGIDFASETDLIGRGIIDSLDIVTIVGEINDKFDVNISVEHLLPTNFYSADSIFALIKKLKQ